MAIGTQMVIRKLVFFRQRFGSRKMNLSLPYDTKYCGTFMEREKIFMRLMTTLGDSGGLLLRAQNVQKWTMKIRLLNCVTNFMLLYSELLAKS